MSYEQDDSQIAVLESPRIGLDVLQSGMNEQGFGIDIPELELTPNSGHYINRVVIPMAAVAIAGGFGINTEKAEPITSVAVPQYGTSGSTVRLPDRFMTCPNPFPTEKLAEPFPGNQPSGNNLQVQYRHRTALDHPPLTEFNYACVGENSEIIFELNNLGPEAANNVVLKTHSVKNDVGATFAKQIDMSGDQVTTTTDCLTDTAGDLSCNIGNIPGYAKTVLRLGLEADYPAKQQMFDVSVSSDNADTDMTNNSTTATIDVHPKTVDPTNFSERPKVRSIGSRRVSAKCVVAPFTINENPNYPMYRGRVYVDMFKFAGKPFKSVHSSRPFVNLKNHKYTYPVKVCTTDGQPRANVEIAAGNMPYSTTFYLKWNKITKRWRKF